MPAPSWLKTYKFDGLTGIGMTWNAKGLISKVPAAVVIKDGKYEALS